jgi:hypothetical protein
MGWKRQWGRLHVGWLAAGLATLGLLAGYILWSPSRAISVSRPPHERLASRPTHVGLVAKDVTVPFDADEVLRRSRVAMGALSTWEWTSTRTHIGAGGHVIIDETAYRHELPDRQASHRHQRTIDADGRETRSLDEDEVVVGRQRWIRAGAGRQPWTCEQQPEREPWRGTIFVPGGDARLVGREDTALGSWYIFESGSPGLATLPPPATGSSGGPVRTWVDAHSYRTVRIELALTDESGNTVFARRFGAFDTPRRIEPPAPCRTATPAR